MSLRVAKTLQPDLAHVLGTAGEEEYRRLLRVLSASRDHFALIPIESNFSSALRDAFLERLGSDLKSSGMRLRVVRLSQDQWDLIAYLDTTNTAASPDAVAVVGLEDTPGMVAVPGNSQRRPPAPAVLNQLREAVRKRLQAPLLIWCDPLSYTALQEHAPDFFDYFTALFTFLDAMPADSLEEFMPVGASQESTWKIEKLPPVSSQTALAFYEEQAERYQEPTAERARALLGLADALWSCEHVNVNHDLERAKIAAEAALSLLSSKEAREDWARGQFILGNILGDITSGDRAENLERAIKAYEAALTVYTREAFPYQWAIILNNLGTRYADRIGDIQPENLERAIHAFESALTVLTKEDFPLDWAMTQNNLGSAYVERVLGNKAENIERAIEAFQAALTVFTLDAFPERWAATQNNLGAAYTQRIEGSKATNLEQAIHAFETALTVRTKEVFPVDRAKTQLNLARVYVMLGVEILDLNVIHLARQCCEDAAQIFGSVGMIEDAARAVEAASQIDKLIEDVMNAYIEHSSAKH